MKLLTRDAICLTNEILIIRPSRSVQPFAAELLVVCHFEMRKVERTNGLNRQFERVVGG